MPARLPSYHALALLTLAALPLRAAEDFPRIAPKPVNPQGYASPIAQPPVPVAAADGQVLLPRLRSLIFVSTPQDVVKAGLAPRQPVVLKDVVVPHPAEFETLAGGYVGKKLTRGDLNRLIHDIVLFYRQHDRPIVDVIVPEQDITPGSVQLVLLQGHVGTITETGNRWFPNHTFRDAIRAKTGDEISAGRMQDDIEYVNANPFHITDLVYHPGEKLGDTDLELKTQDRFPVRPYVGYEDSGTASTGFDRYIAGFNWGDAFNLGLDQQLNYQYTTSGDGDSLRAHAGSYVVPLPWRNTLTIFGSYVDTKGTIPPLVNVSGRSYQISGRYEIPLPRIYDYRQSFSFGFDYKYNKNSLEFGGLSAPSTLVDTDQFVFLYNGSLTDPYGVTTLSQELTYSPGGFGGHNTDFYYNLSHAGATSDYVYDTIVAERTTRLPWDWSLLLRGTVQFSDANLSPSEQLGFGGYDSVRGYDEREVNGDEGFIFTTELRTPSVSISSYFHHPELKDQLQFLGFWDYGASSNHQTLPGEPSEVPLSSLGLGLRYSLNTYVSVRYDYGFQLLHTGFDKDHDNRSDLGIVVSY